jgi:hypothetical protein
MSHRSVVSFIVNVCTGLRLSQRKTLGELVFGAMQCRRVSLADIGRSLDSAAMAKHCIKRVYRFIANPRVEVTEGARALLHLASKHAQGRFVMALDWVDIRGYKVLRAAVPLRGRSVPIIFGAYEKWQLYKSQNNLEEGLVRLLKALTPPKSEIVLLADRGFARAEFARALQEIGISYIIRLTGQVHFRSKKHQGRLDAIMLKPGQRRDLGFGAYRKQKPVRQRVLAYWGRGYREPWFLGSDLEWGWKKLVAAFQRRMLIEELFRDEKNIRYGWGLRQLSLSTKHRLERMLLVLAFAYLFLLLLGLICAETMSPAHWAAGVSHKKKARRQLSAFYIGRLMLGSRHHPLRLLLRHFQTLLLQVNNENWG